MKKEILNIYNENRQKIGTQERNLVHKNGSWHDIAHIWAINEDNELLIHKRPDFFTAYPGKWHISAAGHIEHHEEILESAKRETFEELGLDIPKNDFQFLGIFKDNHDISEMNFFDRVFIHAYLVKIKNKIEDIPFNKHEIAQIRFIKLEQFLSEINNPAEFKKYLKQKEYFLNVVEKINNLLAKI